MQHFTAHNSNQKQQKEKRKTKMFSLHCFSVHTILQDLLS